MKMRFLLLSGLFLGVVCNIQAAIVDGYGVSVVVGGVNFLTSDVEGIGDGGELVTSAAISTNTFGSANASAKYTGLSSTFLPILSADALSGMDERAYAFAYGVQGYTYSGISKSITINFNLHGSVGDNVVGAIAEDNELLAFMTVVSSSSIPATAGIFHLLLDSPAIDPGDFIAYGDASITNGINQNSLGSLTFNVFNGMDFYVAAEIDANTKNGFADGSNTFTMQFDDATGLTAVAMSAVPVPAAVWLFGSGLISLIGIARRKQQI